MSLRSFLHRVDERAGVLPRHGPFDCAWCADGQHLAGTGVAVGPRLPGGGLLTLHRRLAESEACACHLGGHVGEAR